MSENTNDEVRAHSEAPAEGDDGASTEGIRLHAEDPAEGADEDAKDGTGS